MATYRIVGRTRDLTAAHVTDVLGIGATKAYERGERLGPRSPVSEVSQWSLRSGDDPEDGVELSTQLERVMERLTPRRDQLWRLADEGYVIDWFCYVGSYATEHAVELSRQLMTQVLELPGELLLDFYEDHPDDDDD
jgi:hypothetical protein